MERLGQRPDALEVQKFEAAIAEQPNWARRSGAEPPSSLEGALRSEHLYLKGCDLSECSGVLGYIIATSRSIVKADFSSCRLDARAVQLIAEALAVNGVLTSLKCAFRF